MVLRDAVNEVTDAIDRDRRRFLRNAAMTIAAAHGGFLTAEAQSATRELVRRSVQEMNIEYPVVIDNDYSIWRAFENNYWPAVYFIDARGKIRQHHFGEGEYEQSEMTIQRLLVEAGVRAGNGVVTVNPGGLEAAGDWADLR
jgi:hypothetical protein